MALFQNLRKTIDYQSLGYAREMVYAAKAKMGKHHHEKRFVIFGRGRSGSTLLVDLLNSSSDIYCDSEILNRPVFSLYGHIENCSKMHPARIYGFKLLSYQIRSVHKLSDPDAFLDHLVNQLNYKMIFITRKNLLRQTLSKHYAAFRNSWHEKGGQVTRPKMKVDLPLLLKNLDEGYQLGLYEEERISRVDHLPLTYEDDLSEPDRQVKTVNKIADYLDTERFETNTSLRKITSNSYADFIENYEEMAKALAPTRYEIHLDS